jgi:predicted CXXCH cytochrome family protein
VLFALLALPMLALADSNVARTVHNLTPAGLGTIKETVPTGVCVFCHTPHMASPQRALWNRNASAVTYQVYASASMRAEVGQPTGSSRLCLSCHDGTVALGSLRVQPTGAPLTLGPMTGKNVLGTDLSGSHPVSFVYDSALAGKHPGLVDPAGLPKEVRLDDTRQLQCTSCHDPHEATIPHFLRNENRAGALCLDCHQPSGWTQSPHATSTATKTGGGRNPWPQGAPQTVAENACNNCHRTHVAAHGPRLMAQPAEPDNCTICHDGSVARKNIASEFAGAGKISMHPINDAQWTHDPVENPANMARHVTCSDCHNSHAATAATGGAGLPGPLQGVPGASTTGAPIAVATHEYDICYKCHATQEPSTVGIVRVDATRIVGSRIGSAKSAHPIGPGAAAAKAVRSKSVKKRGGSSAGMSCIDCHNNSDWSGNPAAPKGSHASRYAPILALNYATGDGTAESGTSYDLCYSCHDRNTLLLDGPGSFPHRAHVVDQNAPCAACHDAHGSRQYAHLIDFMVRDMSGKTVVTANAKGVLGYTTTAPGQGSCDLACHGVDHDATAYGSLLSSAGSLRRSASAPATSGRSVSPAGAPTPPPSPLAPSAIGPMRATPTLSPSGGR